MSYYEFNDWLCLSRILGIQWVLRVHIYMLCCSVVHKTRLQTKAEEMAGVISKTISKIDFTNQSTLAQ